MFARGPRGPLPAGSSHLSPARLRALQTVADLGGTEVSLHAVAERIGGHPNASRQHLDGLVKDGYLTAVDLHTGGPGRRPRGHTLTPLGRRELASGASEQTELVEVFASYLISNGQGGTEQAHAIGDAWADKHAEAAGSHEHAVDAVVEVLDILGFDPERADSPEGETLVLHTCPLLDAAHANPQFICQIHQGLIDGILRRVGAREGLKLLPFADNAGCRITRSA